MLVIPLSRTPNQSFTLVLDGERWGLVFKETRAGMCADVFREGEPLLSGTRVLAGEAIIPYRYLQTGNFILQTDRDELPDWRFFGVSQMLLYLNPQEIAAVPRITIGEILAAQRRIEFLTTDDGFYLTTDTGGVLTDD